MFDLRRLAKSVVTPFREYLGRLTVADRHLRGRGLAIGTRDKALPVRRGVEVDHVDGGERLATVRPDTQDFVIADHCLQRCEDPIGTLHKMLRVVRAHGVVYLAVPDQRLGSDRDRPATTVEQLVREHEHGPAASRQATCADVGPLHCWTAMGLLHLLSVLQARHGFPRFDVAEFVADQREMVVVLRRLP